MRPGLIIFDCDGVLIDSEVIACRLLAEALAREGYPLSPQEAASRFIGISHRAILQQVERELGRPLSADFEAVSKQHLHTAFERELQAVAGIHEALDAIDIPVCVASGSAPDRLEVSLRVTGLSARFGQNVFSSVTVGRGKPAPDLFLFAARQMGTQPERCLVIEDSIPGVQAAVAAGMFVLGFCGASHCTLQQPTQLLNEGAAAVFSTMAALPRLIT
jgi:HAD superfamily hydrolase (TIGR01509 family)